MKAIWQEDDLLHVVATKTKLLQHQFVNHLCLVPEQFYDKKAFQ